AAQAGVGVGAALTAAVTWNRVTWWRGLPSSSSHALIGGLVGAAIVEAGAGAVNWGGGGGGHPTGGVGGLGGGAGAGGGGGGGGGRGGRGGRGAPGRGEGGAGGVGGLAGARVRGGLGDG